jgi:sugar phosphate isomerase/epimerase
MRLGLSIYSFKQAWVDAYGLIDRAAAAGLQAVEIPTENYQGTADLARLREYAAEHGIGIIADGGVIEAEALRRWLPQAKAVGAPALRVIVSKVLGGNRRQLNGGWRAHLEAARDALRAVRPVAEEYDIPIAIENHQDVASDELRWLCEEVGGDHIGVTLDTGSTLALAEDPIGYTKRVKDYVKNIHIKDYKIALSPTGYRLVTCGIGAGVVDFPAFFALFADQPDLPMNIELGARQARHVELLEEDWWTDYPPRRPQDALPALRVVFAHGRPTDEDWRLPHERGESDETCRTYELDELAASVAYLRQFR